MAKRKKIKNIGRKTLQWLVMGLLGYMIFRLWVDPNYFPDFEAYCPFGGLQAFTSFFVNNSLACSMTECQIFMGVVLAVGAVLFSKLFCSYICPIGTVTEWLGRIGDRFNVRYQIKGLADRLLRALKYILLFVTVYFTVTSSELFCKEYDPYYAIVTGFGHDVVFWYAIIALAVTVLGAIFIRQFWCKYLCPLGALTNIFTNAVVFAGILVVYLFLLYFGVDISFVWPLAAMSILGYALEATQLKAWLFPVFKITRNADTCTSCGLCDTACPMGLDVATVDTVEHIDCHLCGDCVAVCPVNDTLQINKRNWKWLPSVATVGLILIGLFLASDIELPTINLEWGKGTPAQNVAVYSQSGLKSVKCYGSSMSFANRMKRVRGVVGVQTYVQSHTVKVFYDSSKIHPETIRKVIFSPAKTLLHQPPAQVQEVQVVTMGIDKIFDSYDSFYFSRVLAKIKGVFGFTSKFGEPVHVTVYFDSTRVKSLSIKKAIEAPQVSYTSRGKTYTVDIRFGVEFISDSIKTISRSDLIASMFTPFNMSFNGYKKMDKMQLAVYQLPMPQAMDPKLSRSMQMLVSHISTDDHVVRFRTLYTDQPYAQIFFVKGKVAADSIYSALNKPFLTVHYRNGKIGKVKNPFSFKQPGSVLEVTGR